MPISILGVRRRNRGGIYPSGVRCENPCVEVLSLGFVEEEVNHAAVAAEEPPPERIRDHRGDDFVSASVYNATACDKDELLVGMFRVPHHDVRHSLLSHNHIMRVLPGFLTKAQWNSVADEETNLICCDDKGKLSLSAVAAHPNGKELAEMIREGVECETLGWKMYIEEPAAVPLISQAFNTG